jgi:hypothetical protein
VAGLAEGYEVGWIVIGFALVSMMNVKAARAVARHTRIAISLSNLFTERSVPTNSVRKDGTATFPVRVALAAVLSGVFLAPLFSRGTVETVAAIPLGFATARTETVVLHPEKYRPATLTRLLSLDGSPMLEASVLASSHVVLWRRAEHFSLAPLPIAGARAEVVLEHCGWAVSPDIHSACVAQHFDHRESLHRGGVSVMSFSYQLGANPPIDYVRLLMSDTQSLNHIFEDEEINALTAIVSLQFQSAQFYSGSQGANLPTSPVSYLRVAALGLDSLAANKARLASIKQLLDVKLDSSDASIQLRATAAEYREVDDNAGAFMIIEQVNDAFSFRDRFWKTVQRNSAV